MAEESWQTARLIPTSGINGPDEAERRATSAVLAVMSSVREFGALVVRPMGAPAGQLATYIEVPFVLGDRTVIPDGLLQTSRAGKTWTCLVEVKTGANELERPQVECYLDVAREQDFDAVLTISNQLAPAPDLHPVEVDRRKLRKVALHHLSWSEVLTFAITQRVHRGVADPDQAWILGELIRYLEHPKSGASDFADMGSTWVAVREAVAAGTLRSNDKALPEVVSRWEQLLRFVALRLSRELGADVQVALTRKEAAEPTARLTSQAVSLVDTGLLTGTIRIPDAVGPMDISADLRTSRVTVSVDVPAPREGRPLTRVNWLIRQLGDAPDNLRIDGQFSGARSTTSNLLRALREDPTTLLDDRREFRGFRVAATSPLGIKRGTGRGGLIDSVLAAVDGLYGAVVSQVRPWAAKAPQLPAGGRSAAETAGLNLTPPPGDLVEDGQRLEPDMVEPGGGLDPAAAAEVNEPSADSDWADRHADATAVDVAEEDTVRWPEAEDRLARERLLGEGAGEASTPRTDDPQSEDGSDRNPDERTD